MGVLEDVRAQRAKVYEQAKTIADAAAAAARNFTEAEQRDYDRLSAELDRYDERIKDLAGGQQRQQQATAVLDQYRSGTGYRDSPPSLLPDQEALGRLHEAARSGETLRVEARAVVTTTDTGASNLATTLTRPDREPRRIAAASGMGAQMVTGLESVEFPIFGSGAAGLATEGAAKTEYDNITPGSRTPVVIAIWSDSTRQNLWTMPDFEARLRAVLAAKVANREDLLLVTEVLGTTGIQSVTGPVSPDLVLQAAAQVAASDVAAEPNLLLLNPADVPTVLGVDVGAGGEASPAFGAFLPGIHGMRVYPSNHVTAGEAILGAWPAAARFIVGLSPTFLVDSTSQIKSNVVTILAEEAVNIAVDEPTGFVHITGGA